MRHVQLSTRPGRLGLLRSSAIGLAVLCSALSPAFGQPHSWPPFPPGRAPMSDTMALPDGRYLPSTVRWNLVWADQIVPDWVTASQLEFAAANFVGTQKIFASQAARFEALNPNFLVLTYHLAAGLNPAANGDCPDPKNNGGSGNIGVVAPKGFVSEYAEYFRPWLAARGIAEGSAAFEAMFQHYDAMTSGSRVWHIDPAWLMNVADTNWRSYLAATCLEWMQGNRNQGTFFDVAVETSVNLYNPNSGNPVPGNFNWWESPHRPFGSPGLMTTRSQFAAYMNGLYREYFQSVYRRFHASDTAYLVIPNVDQMITTVYDPVWLDGDAAGETVDGVMIESFGRATGGDMYLTLERTVRHITGRGKILIAQSYATGDGERLRVAGMYMLVKDENSYINFLSQGGVEWYPEYEIDLGRLLPVRATLEEMRAAGSGRNSLWRRMYERGMVLCNTSDVPMEYTLPWEGWWRVETSGGGTVGADGNMPAQSIATVPVSGKVTIPPSGCLVLLTNYPSGIDANRVSGFDGIQVFPQPARDNLFIRSGGDGARIRSARIISALGTEIPLRSDEAKVNGAGLLSLDVRRLSAGCYTAVLDVGGRIRPVLFIVARTR